MKLTQYQQTLLAGWEEIYKKSQLTFWILLALKKSPSHMAEIKDFITHITNKQIQFDDKSMYRALRRFANADLISFTEVINSKGPKLKVYNLTDTGQAVFREFNHRNISLFNKPTIQKLLY